MESVQNYYSERQLEIAKEVDQLNKHLQSLEIDEQHCIHRLQTT